MLKLNIPFRIFIEWTLLIICCMLYSACTDNTLTGDTPVPPGSQNGEVPVRITIRTAASPGQQYTRSQVAGETAITQMKVVVYEDDTYAYMVVADVETSNSTSTTFKASLKTYAGKVKLCFFANANDFFPPEDEWAVITQGSEAGINEYLYKTITGTGVTGNLPMYGEYVLPEGLTYENKNEINDVNMLRAVARVDVILDENVEDFTLTTVQVFRASNQIGIVPIEAIDYSDPVVTEPTIPASATTIDLDEIPVTDNKLVSGLYIPESAAVVSNYKTTAVCLVVGGHFSDGTMNYYRIDFRSDETIGQVLRNHRYVFRIQGVEAGNTVGAADAAVNGSQNITTILEKWEDEQTNEITDGINFFGFSTRKLLLRFRAGSAGFVNIRTDLDTYSIRWVDDKGVSQSDEYTGTSISYNGFSAEIQDRTTGPSNENLSNIRITALDQNDTNSQRTGYLLIKAGKWNVTIRVNQLTGGDYSNIVINILNLSTTGYGDLGGSYPGGSSGTATAIRPILLNHDNFGPDGTVPIKYVGIDNVPRTISTGDLTNVLSMYDILNVMSDSNPTAQQSQVISDWLKGNPNRVLFVSHWNDANNKELLTKLDAMTSWVGGGTGSSSGRTFRATTSTNPAVDYFLQSGPFGGETISNFNSYNGYWMGIQPNTALHDRVIPLIESTVETMGCIVGVDTGNRIVYVGHPWLYQRYNDNIMNTSGQVEGRGVARLFANIYAWAIEEIIIPGKLE